MKLLYATVLLAILAVALGKSLPEQHEVLLSDRNYVPEQWTRLHRSNPEDIQEFKIFLKQRNIDQLENLLINELSNPASKRWAQHLSIDQILDIVAPADSSVQIVLNWLTSNGVESSKITNYRDSLKVVTTVKVVESLFKTEIYQYKRDADGVTINRQWGKSFISASVSAQIDIFTGIDDFLPPPRKLKTRPMTDPLSEAANLGYVIPETIRKAYNVPAKSIKHPLSSVGLIEFQNDNSFNPQDLVYFQEQVLVDATPVTKIIGPYNPTNPDAESTLDVQYAAAMADNITIWFWTVTGWLLDFSQAFFNSPNVPLVASMSWGWTENQQCAITNCNGMSSEQYVARVNNEWMKIAARGVSMFAASGDQGAPGDGNAYCDSYTTPLTPIFPGDSPYITSVGATMLVASKEESSLLSKNAKRATPPICNTIQCATTTAEGVCTYPDALITSGGGFSTFTETPSWQKAAVSAYLKSGVALPPAQYFNSSNRGFPDVSALGHNYVIRLAQQWVYVDGTSCSSPVWAALIGLVNDARLVAGKKPIGFVAPHLYALNAQKPSAFHDITTGNNKCTEECCASYGYEATRGWDPVCGLGSPDYPSLEAYFMSLP